MYQKALQLEPKPCVQLETILKQKLASLTQPIFDQQSLARIEEPVNHLNGLPACVTKDATNRVKSNLFLLQVSATQYYFDLTLNCILNLIKCNQQYDGVKAIKFYSDGNWQVLNQSTEEMQLVESYSNSNQIKALDKCSEQILSFYNSISAPNYSTLKLQANQNEFIINYLQTRISNPLTASFIGPALVSRATFEANFRFVEILFPTTLKTLLLQTCLKSENKAIKNLSKSGILCTFHQDSVICCHSLECIVIVGGTVIEEEQGQVMGLDSVFIANFNDYLTIFSNEQRIINFLSSSHSTNYLRFEKLPVKLRNKRQGFQITVCNNYLYVIGGYIGYDKIPVKSVERISIQNLVEKTGAFEECAQLPVNLVDFNVQAYKKKIILTGGQIIQNFQKNPNTQSYEFDMSNSKWEVKKGLIGVQSMKLMCGLSPGTTNEGVYWEGPNMCIMNFDNFSSQAYNCNINNEERKQMALNSDYANPVIIQALIQSLNSKLQKRLKFLLRAQWIDLQKINCHMGAIVLVGVEEKTNQTIAIKI